MEHLIWPEESANPASRDKPHFVQAGSNICLDFHGDPLAAELVVFSDGNHHMALQESLRAFLSLNPAVKDVFYTTTPPSIALKMVRAGSLDVGNLRLSVNPHVFISPPEVLDQLVAENRMKGYRPFMRSRGVVMLVRKDNPKRVLSLSDLLRDDVKLFLSNPVNEKVSYQIYTDCLRRLALHEGITLEFLSHMPGRHNSSKIMYGQTIHHREAPQAVAHGEADVALVFYHLALRYQRVFPDRFDFVWPIGSIGEQDCDINHFSVGLIGDGGIWGRKLEDFLMTEEVTAIYTRHGLERAG